VRQPSDDLPGEVLLSVRSMAVGIGGKRLFESLDLELRAQQIVALRGPSGCGKSTFLRTLAGLVDPLAGELTLAGRTPADHGWPSYRHQVSYLAQRAVVSDASVLDNLAFPFTFSSASGRQLDQAAASEMLAKLGLPEGVIDAAARTLSEGQMQRVCLARALLIEPRVLLLDEPTSALDPEATEQVEQVICHALEATAAAAIVVTHHPAQVERLAARIVDLQPLTTPGNGHG
jgi:ABC-type iron transport system FetAB ATPase subunit